MSLFLSLFWLFLKKNERKFLIEEKNSITERFSSLFLSLFSFWVITTDENYFYSRTKRWEESAAFSLVFVSVCSRWSCLVFDVMFTSERNKTFVCLRVVSISSILKKEITTKERSAARTSHEWIDTHRWYHSSLWSSSRLRKRSYLITRPSLRFLRRCVRRISRLSRRRWRSLYVETYSTNCLLRRVRSRQSNQWRKGNEKEGKKKTTNKTFSVETFFDRKNIFFLHFFLLQPWIFHSNKIFASLSLFENALFWRSVFVFVSFSAYALLNERTFCCE